MRLLYVTSLSGKRINGFMRSAIIAAKSLGFEFTMACNTDMADKAGYEQDCKEYGIETAHIDFDRNPLGKKNKIAYQQLNKLMSEREFDIVHCNTPIGGVLGRICAKKNKIPAVIYQAHGFHFWKGAPLQNWLFYYPVEKLLSHWTDVLITINKEDYKRAKKHMHAKQVEYVPGVGIDFKRFAKTQVDRAAKRKEIGIPEDAILLLSVGELIERKNHASVIRSLAELNEKRVHYVIAGMGPLKDSLTALAISSGVEKQVHLIGFRQDVAELFKAADVFVFPSHQEGLPMAVMEAMAAGLPIVASAIRGTIDLLENSDNPLVADSNDVGDYAKKIKSLCASDYLRVKIGQNNQKAAAKYNTLEIVEQMMSIYKRCILQAEKQVK